MKHSVFLLSFLMLLSTLIMAQQAKPAPAAEKSNNKMAACNAKTKGMSKEDANKARSECMKAT